MKGTMKELHYIDAGDVRLVEAPIPDCTDDGILVKVAYAGICGSDIQAYTICAMAGGLEGSDIKFGHEFSGIVVEVGKNVTEFKVGDRVWADPEDCILGTNACMAGAFAEYVPVYRPKKDKSVFIIPEEISLRDAALIEPFGVGLRTKNRAKVQKDDKVLLYGAGPIGLMCYASLVNQGVENIIVAERMASRIEFARSLGADVFDNTEASVYDYAREKFGSLNYRLADGADIDVVIDCVGFGPLVNEFVANARYGARYVSLGIGFDPVPIVPGMFMLKELSFAGSRGYTPEDIEEVIECLLNKKVDITRVITGEFALEDYKAAFEAACDREKGLKVLFKVAGE